MKTYTNCEDLKEISEEIYLEYKYILDTYDYSPDDLYRALGGNVTLLETIDEARTLDISPTFNDVYHLTPSRKYIIYVLITNNAGGTSYIFPSEFYKGDDLKIFSYRGNLVEIKRISPISKKEVILQLPIDIHAYESWLAGEKLIQDAFPYLTADEREFIKTGITADEWSKIFDEDDLVN